MFPLITLDRSDVASGVVVAVDIEGLGLEREGELLGTRGEVAVSE